MSDFDQIDSYLEKNLDKSIAELSRLVAQPSISAQGIGLKECSNLVADMLRARGFTAEVMDTEGAPVVFALAEVGTGARRRAGRARFSCPRRRAGWSRWRGGRRACRGWS